MFVSVMRGLIQDTAGPAAYSMKLILIALSLQYNIVSPIQVPQNSVRIFVAKLPPQFQSWSPEELWGFRGLGHAVDIKQSLWEANWHSVDKWWINQLNVSPLRTAEVNEADVVFVPATIRQVIW